MCYQHIKGPNRFDQRSFYGERISAYDLNYRCPRICPLCFRECPVWWAVWDLGLVAACPLHRCHLLNRCPACKRSLAWQRPAVHQCRCGLDFRTITPEPATSDLIAINAAMFRAAGFSPGADAEHDLKDFGFPPGMLGLKLGGLLRFILFVGAIREKDGLRRKQRPFSATDLVAATEIDRSAVAVLRDWPRPLREVLRHMLPPESTHPASLNFSAIFGNFYRHVFRVLPRSEFGFLHDLFEKFVIEDWKGLIRGQHRYFSAAVRQNSPWVTAGEAERIARTGGGKVLDAVHQGQLEALFVTVRLRREPNGMLDPARIVESMDCCPRCGTRALHAAPGGEAHAGTDEHHDRQSRRGWSDPLRGRAGAKLSRLAFSSSFGKMS